MTTTEPSSVTQQFAIEYARNTVPTMLKAIDSIKRYNRFILLGALATSYLHQAHYLWTQKAGYFAYLVPLIFDAAMVSMLTVVRTPGIAKDAKRGAIVVFAAAALLSATINFAAPGSLGLRLVFALVVVLVIGVELVAGRIRPDFAAIEAEAAALLAAAHNLATKNQPTNQPTTDTATADTAPPETRQQTSTRDDIPPAAVPATPTPVVEPDSPAASAEPVPAHLLPTARFAVVNHQQTTGRPITVDELAARLSIPPAVARQLLTSITGTTATTPAPINGTPVTVGGAP